MEPYYSMLRCMNILIWDRSQRSLAATVLKCKKVLRISRQLNLVRLQTLTKSPVTSNQCTMPLQNGAILLYVTVYEYFHLRQISKQLGCYSPKMKNSSENLSSVEFSEASKFDKIPSCVKSVHHAVTEWSHITLCYGVWIFSFKTDLKAAWLLQS